MEFPLDINVSGDYDVYVNAVAGDQSTIEAEVWVNGSQIALPFFPVERDSAMSSWIHLGKFNLAKDETCSVKILASSGGTGETVIADAVRAVLCPVTGNQTTSWVKAGTLFKYQDLQQQYDQRLCGTKRRCGKSIMEQCRRT